MRPPRVRLVGRSTRDRNPHGLEPGGCVRYAAQVHAAFGSTLLTHPAPPLQGLSPSLLSSSGPEPAAPAAPASASAAQALPPLDEALVFCNRYDAMGRREQRVERMVPPVFPSAPLPWVEILHLAPVLGEVPLGPWLEAAPAGIRGAGLQGWTRRAARGRVRPARSLPPWALLAELDVIFASDEDLEGHPGLLESLRGLPGRLLLTHGPFGSTAFESGREPRRIPTPRATSLDPTGAGDSFAAATLQGLARGMSLPAAAALGAEAGARCVEHRGLPPVSAFAGLSAGALRRIRPGSRCEPARPASPSTPPSSR
ncbi:MAG: PfkB family carbohydrate kinase [Myxococcales bacterium]|nr:PfkB family carbohydrate kinase [Myxococcales bacterium]